MNPKIYLAPLSGITDLPFRLISREMGAKHCFFPMLDSNATVYNNPATLRYLRTIVEDYPISAQLVGSDPAVMLEAAKKIISLADISFLDINSACPAKKIIRKGAGAALLHNTERLGQIVDKLSSNLKIPVTVKLRTGFNKRDVQECVNTARICETKGASTVFIHGRTKTQGYAGSIDYEAIKAVKDAVKIPVFGSGNIITPVMARKMLNETGCDGLLVARGALGNPWIFKNIETYLKNGEVFKKPPMAEREEVLARHLAYIEKYNDMTETNRIGYMGKVTRWYLKGDPHCEWEK
jgi:nifR3 family TIM-barrel protein